MKTYQAVWLVIKGSGTPSAKQNKLLKLSLETQDFELSAALQDLAQWYGWYIKSPYCRTPEFMKQYPNAPMNFDRWRAGLDFRLSQMEQYLTERLAQQKPSWQVSAEKAGWSPPLTGK